MATEEHKPELLALDTGGTMTDSFAVDRQGRYTVGKAQTTPEDESVGVVDSMRLATDIDEPGDLVEVLLHTDGRSAAWLRDAGFEVDDSESRVGIRRADE